MEGFNDVWANILNDDLLNKREILTPIPHTKSSPHASPVRPTILQEPLSAPKFLPSMILPASAGSEPSSHEASTL